MRRPQISVGRSDGSDLPRWFFTLAEAEREMERIEEIDPDGVERGDYYIDAPEGLAA